MLQHILYHHLFRFVCISLVPLWLSACAVAPVSKSKDLAAASYEYSVKPSYLQREPSSSSTNDSQSTLSSEDSKVQAASYQPLQPLQQQRPAGFKQNILSRAFSDQATLQAAVEDMPMRDFLHYVFGDLLQVNYILDDVLKEQQSPVTLSLTERVSPRKLFELTNELLQQRGVQVVFNEDIYLLRQVPENSKANVVAAIGRSPASVPNTSQDVLQIVPLVYGVNISLERTLRELTEVAITPDFEQNALFLKGKREQILRALEFVELLDTPANRGQFIGLIDLTFIDVESFSDDITKLLETEGVPVSAGSANGKNIVMIPLKQMGSIAVFATSEQLLNRVKYWAQVLDKPIQGATKQYFVYTPEFARASDIGESLSQLLGGMSALGGSRNSASANPAASTSAASSGNAPTASRATGASGEDFTMVVDERTNALVFFTTGVKYQSVLPLLRQLDVLPKQVMLDITIAEVTLKDEFKYGVEWALQQGETTITTQGAFGVSSIGGLGILINGNKGPVNASLLKTSSLVNVLSKPTLLVRDGVSATINVGSDISVVGATTTDPINSARQTTSTEYRKTGVDVTVTPTVNARGVVLMEVNQKISNSVPSSSGAGGNPDIFERSIQTEVVANSGQTVLLGGLISEDANRGDSSAPGLSKLPGLGWLFKAEGDSASRTELIMLITPRVVLGADDSQESLKDFKQGLNFLTLGNS